MASKPWCRSIAVCPKENYVAVGFENSIVRFFGTTGSEKMREDCIHSRHYKGCTDCPSVDTLSFSNDGLVLIGSTRSAKNGTIQIYSWRFPFLNFQELPSCRYQVPLHESEDNGVSSAIFRSALGGEDDLICITTWTQSGVPVLVQPGDGHRSDIRTEVSNRQGKLGSRVQCAAFSPSGRELALVNDKGNLYQISSLNSKPLDVRRIATSRELTAKTESFAMSFVTLPDEEAIMIAWADSSKAIGFVKKIPMGFSVSIVQTWLICFPALDSPIDADLISLLKGDLSAPTTPGVVYLTAHAELPGDDRQPPMPPVELTVTEDNFLSSRSGSYPKKATERSFATPT